MRSESLFVNQLCSLCSVISGRKPNLTVNETRLRPQPISGHNIYFSILIQPYCPVGHQPAVLPEQGRIVLPSG